jgi:hypothetical protein
LVDNLIPSKEAPSIWNKKTKQKSSKLSLDCILKISFSMQHWIVTTVYRKLKFVIF